MKTDRAQGRRKGRTLRQAWQATPRCKRHPAGHAAIPARSTCAALRTRVATLALVLLLCAAMGAVEATAPTYAAPSQASSADAPAHRPTGTPPGRRTPTPTTSPSPTFPTAPTATLQPTGAASAPPTAPVQESTPQALQPPRGNLVPQPSGAATFPANSAHHPSQDRPGSVLPLLAPVMATLSAGACSVSLLALGLRRRNRLISPKAKQRMAPTVRNWQRERPASQDGDPGSGVSGSLQTLPSPTDGALKTSDAERTTEPSRPVRRERPCCLSGFSLTTSEFTLVPVQPHTPAWAFTDPTSSAVLTTHPKASGSIPRFPASARLGAAGRKRQVDTDMEQVPSTHDSGGEETLEEYIRRGRLAWQSRGGEPSGDGT